MEIDNSQRIKNNQKQQGKLSWKRSEARKMADSIREFLYDNGIDLPGTKLEYKNQREILFSTDCRTYNVLDKRGKIIGTKTIYCIDDDFANHFEQLINMYYKLISTNKAVYAMFENLGVHKPMLLMAWYTKHRLDPVWLMRKSQLIRRLYLNYFNVATVLNEYGNKVKLVEHLQPYHLTLTVPHAGGVFAEKRFYAQELNKFFLMLRRSKFWKNSVHGGEYGIEVKPSTTGNGLHIHIHSLVFLEQYVNEAVFFKSLKKRWKSLTAATEVHFEKLYVWKKEFEEGCIKVPVYTKKNGKRLQQVVLTENSDGSVECEPVYRFKKYITPQSNVDDYMKGVLECIKYHFKTDSITDENGNYDVPLIADILNDSRGLRFYSKFGAFYKEQLLNFDKLKKEETELQPVEDTNENIMGSIQNSMQNLVNPFTKELADESQYEITIAVPETLKYSSPKSLVPYSLMNYDDSLFIPVADTNATLPDIVKLLTKNKLHTILGVRPNKRKNHLHFGFYENDFFLPEQPFLSFDNLEVCEN